MSKNKVVTPEINNDELIEDLQGEFQGMVDDFNENIYISDLQIADLRTFYKECRELEFEFRKVNRKVDLDLDNNEHYKAMTDLIEETKNLIDENANNKRKFDADYSDDLVNKLDELRYEMIDKPNEDDDDED